MADIYKNIEDYSPNKKRIMLIIFDDMLIYLIIKNNPIVTELFISGRNLKIFVVFITHSCLLCQKILTKFYALFYYENSKQTRSSCNCIYLFIRY